VLEHVDAVVFQVRALLPGELADAYPGVDAPRIQKLVPDFCDDDQFLAAGERYVALVKQMIDVRRQQQPIGAIESFSVVRVSPRLDVTRFQMPGLVHARDVAELFPQENVGAEDALTTPRSDELLPERRAGNAGVDNRRLEVGRFGHALRNGDRRVRVPVRLTDETDESVSEGLRELREVDGLEAISAFLKRRVLRRQERTKNRCVVFGADLVVQEAVVDGDEPTFARPVRTGGAEVGARAPDLPASPC